MQNCKTYSQEEEQRISLSQPAVNKKKEKKFYNVVVLAVH